MEFGDDFAKQLTEIFKAELDEKAQTLTDNLLQLEKGNLSAEDKKITIESIFRAGHNIKGAAHGVGISDVGQIAHSIESIFSGVQKQTIPLTPQLISLCFESVDKMLLAMQAFLDKTSLPFSLEDLLTRLQKTTENLNPPEAKPAKIEPAIIEKTPPIIEKKEAEPLTKSIDIAPSVSPSNSLNETEKEKPTTLIEKPGSTKTTETINTTPRPSTANYQTIHVSLRHLDKVSALMERMQISKIAVEEQNHEIAQLSNKLNTFNDIWKRSSVTLKNIFSKNNATAHLFDLSDLVTEISQLSQKFSKNLHEQINEFSTISNLLQEEIRLLRLIPANTLLRTMPRYVRDLALELNKKIEFHIHGEEVKMDKIILESLQDPLIHLLRNAIDHGIEESDFRSTQGKAETAQLNITFREEGSQIQIKIQDDGSGINTKKIAAAALDKKLVTQSELDNMSDKDILYLIFRPGFSTKNSVSELSGRGIGLDVVKTNLENLKGSVEVETEIGKGTTFILRVPLTLASERGLLIQCLSHSFMIPTHSIERVLMINTADVLDVETCQTILLDKKPLHLIYLADILQLQSTGPISGKQIPVVIIKKNDLSVALVVDTIIGEREIVIKPLQAPLHNIPCITGGTLSGNGDVVLVLNTDEIVNQAYHVVSTPLVREDTEAIQDQVKAHILVVDDSITTRTLEKNVLESKDYLVTVAVDGKQAWETLQKQAFSLLITDVNMPHMDGIELVEQIRKSEKLRDLPIIMVTSLGSDEEKIRGMEAGADYYIVKSDFESGALLTIVEQLV